MRRYFLRLLLAAGFCLAIFTSAAQATTVEQWNTPAPRFINRRDLAPRDLVKGKLVTNVVLPTGYKSRACWPVVYLLHGTADSAQPVSLQWLQINDGALLKMNIPAILVIPGSGDSWWVNNWWHGLRHPAFESWVLQDLVPLATKRLHICSGRSEHAIAGLSMGGYGAIYLASQLPGYFGSAGSFSGVLSPESSNFVTIYPSFPTYWGPPGKFYALGHDPLALVGNLKSTRLFVSAGNGTPKPGDVNTLTAVFEETEFDQESIAFVKRARSAGDAVTFDQLVGTHSAQTWLDGLSDMLKWRPFRRAGSPSRWTFTTVATTGSAWDYQYAFSRYAPPSQLIQFSLSHGVFSARGGGEVTITQPDGKSVRGRIPFNIVRGRVVELPRAPKPHVVGGYQKLLPVTITVQPPVSATEPATVSFQTTQTLPSNEEYQVAVAAGGLTGGSCSSLAFQRVSQPAKGKTVSVNLSPPSNTTTPNTWCSGTAYAAVSAVPKGAGAILGSFLGYKTFTLP